jgi:hypothetical protein
MKWVEITQEKLKENFKALLSDLLNANSTQFLAQAKEKVNEILVCIDGFMIDIW